MLSANLPQPPNFDALYVAALKLYGARLVDFGPYDEQAQRMTAAVKDETPEDQAAFVALCAAHDPAQQTDAQRAEARRAQARQAYKQLQTLRGMTPDEAEAWVRANVTDLASARNALALMARLLVILARVGELDDA